MSISGACSKLGDRGVTGEEAQQLEYSEMDEAAVEGLEKELLGEKTGSCVEMEEFLESFLDRGEVGVVGCEGDGTSTSLALPRSW